MPQAMKEADRPVSSPLKVCAEPETTDSERSLDDQITNLYSELEELMARVDEDQRLTEVIEDRFTELRELQLEEAKAMRKRFEARFHLKPGSGWEALRQAKRLVHEAKHFAEADATSIERD